jgi:hypothetical protein
MLRYGFVAKLTLGILPNVVGGIRLEFGDAPPAVFDDRKVRGDILAWRDRSADRPRSADGGIEVMSRLLSGGENRGRLKINAATGIERLYEVDRSEVIWEKADFDRFIAAAPIEVREGVELAAATGLRRGDLVKAAAGGCGRSCDYMVHVQEPRPRRCWHASGSARRRPWSRARPPNGSSCRKRCCRIPAGSRGPRWASVAASMMPKIASGVD